MKDVVTSAERRQAYVDEGLWTDDTLASLFEASAESHPTALAVVDGSTGRQVTYGQLLQDVRTLSSYYAAHGIEPGDTISVQLPNGYAAVVAHMAAFYSGAVLNPLLPNYRTHELRHILSVGRTKLLVTPATYRSFDFPAMVEELKPGLPCLRHHLVADAEPDVRAAENLEGVLQGPAQEFARVKRPSDEVSEVIFTSGTEAAPKAVMHTEKTLGFAIRNTISWLGMGASEVIWMPSPVGHSTGLNFGIRMALSNGYPLVLQDRWDPEQAVDLIGRYRCTYTLASTTFLTDLLRASVSDPGRVGSLRLFCCGGAPVPPALVAEAESIGIGVLRVYGSTELILASWTRPDAPVERRTQTDGSVMAHVELAVWDDQGNVVAPGEVGELVARSPATAVGFAFDQDRTKTTFLPGGWVRSGDLVRVENGDLTVVGRKKEIIIRGGLNIAPRDIESALLQINGVASVAVIGLPDDRLGEIACACLIMDEGVDPIGVDETSRFLTEHAMARYK
ncbi:MAG: AMP-binding protein, partial [Acidimicrobiales bacterium]